MTRPIAFAAPVLFGVMLTAAARATAQIALAVRPVQRHLVARVRVDGGHVALLDLRELISVSAMGARQFVVQEAAEMIVSVGLSVFSLTL